MKLSMLINVKMPTIVGISSVDPEGRTGGSDPPGKSQDLWVSIGNKQLDPLEKVGPPHPLENVRLPLER